MTRKTPKLLSVVAPMYNEEGNVFPLYERLRDVLEEIAPEFEILLVDNGSSDRTLEYLKELSQKDPRVRYLSLSRNYMAQGGILAGLHYARGDVVVSIDGDLQQPPEVIPEMLEEWRKGYDVVYTLKKEHGYLPVHRRITNRLYYALISYFSGLELQGGQSDFRLMDRNALDAMLALPEKGKFLRGLSQWIGFSQTGVYYEVADRTAGRTKFRILDLFRFALDGIFSFSILPLRLFTVLGSIIAALALANAFFNVAVASYRILMGIPDVPGFPTLVTGVFLLSGIQLIGIGLLGEYLGRVYDEVKNRPSFIVKETSADKE
jgi:polyisoprenyl-phosphate glycosyltransferase